MSSSAAAARQATLQAILKQRSDQTAAAARAQRLRLAAQGSAVSPMSMPPSGMLRIWNDLGALTAIIRNSSEAADGVAVWNDQERAAGLPPLPEIGGRTLDTQTFQIRLEQGRTTTSGIEQSISLLRAFGRPRSNGDEPPPVYVMGLGLPFPATQPMRIDSLQRGERRTIGDTAQLRYHEFTIALSEWIDETLVPQAAPRSARTAAGKRRSRTIKSVEGATMRSIAVTELGLATRWTDLREWNPSLAKADPDAPLRPGTKIVIK